MTVVRRESIWIKGTQKTQFKGKYVVKKKGLTRVRKFALVNATGSKQELFNSHEHAKKIGWRKA